MEVIRLSNFMIKVSWVIFLAIFVNSCTIARGLKDDEDLIIRKISTGLIRGKKLITPANVEGFMYLSIPNAEPPIGSLRFKAPIPRKSWNGTFDAQKYGLSCYWNSEHTSYLPSLFNMSEDCINVNVFTNRYCLINGGCAVAMYMGGGSFRFGTPQQYRPNFLIDNFCNATRNVVLVTVSVRQAIFGVANFNPDLKLSIDMNAGVHDFIHHLKWIKNEISVFGGDPNKITIMADSGGANCARSLAMNPRSKHLFQQLILMSQAGEYNFVPDQNQAPSRASAQILGCANFSINDERWNNLEVVEGVIDCLRKKPVKELFESQPQAEALGYGFRGIAKDSGEIAIAPKSYYDMVDDILPIPMLIGGVTKEFLYSKDAVYSLPNGEQAVNETSLIIWSKRALEEAEYLDPDSGTIAAVAREYNSVSKAIFVFDDVLTHIPSYEFAVRQASKGTNVWLYEYTYQDVGDAYDNGPHKIPRSESPKHAQELNYLLGQHIGNYTSKDYQIKYLFSQIFVDFINHGTPASPTRHWSKLDSSKGNYFVIDFPEPSLKFPGETPGYHDDTVKFWTTVVPKLEGPKTKIEFANQLGYSPVDVKMVQNYAKKKEEQKDVKNLKRFYLKYSAIFWIVFWVVIFLVSVQLWLCVRLYCKRNKYQYI